MLARATLARGVAVVRLGNGSTASLHTSRRLADDREYEALKPVLYPGAIHGTCTWDKEIRAGRAILGHGVNGRETYMDRLDYWYPGISWRKWDEPQWVALRAKAEGDWHKLTKDEAKLLYRYMFKQTLSEFNAHSQYMGYWKITFCFMMSGFFLYAIAEWLQQRVMNPYLPETITYPEFREAMFHRMVHLEHSPITGYARKYDYENDRWIA